MGGGNKMGESAKWCLRSGPITLKGKNLFTLYNLGIINIDRQFI